MIFNLLTKKYPVQFVCFIDATINNINLTSSSKVLLNLTKEKESVVDNYSRAVANRPDVSIILYDIVDGPTIIIFDDENVLSKKLAKSITPYLQAISKTVIPRILMRDSVGFPILNSMKTVKGNIFIRLSKDVDPERFKKFISQWVDNI